MSKKKKLSKEQVRIASESLVMALGGCEGFTKVELNALAKKFAKALVAGLRIVSKSGR